MRGFRKPSALIGAGTLLVAIGASTLSTSAIAPATSCLVTSNGDQPSANNALAPCRSTSGQVTLRSAIELFNVQKGQLAVNFSPSLATPTTINLANGVLDVTDTTTADKITITGAGIDRTIVNAQHASAIVHSAGAMLSFNAMTLENGQTASGASGIVAGPTGGLFVTSCVGGKVADVSMTSVRLTGNVVTGGEVYAGAILANHVSIHDSFITGNSATATGKGRNYDGLLDTCNHVDLVSTRVSGNTGAAAPQGGLNHGMIVINDGGATVTNSTITLNTASAPTGGVDGVFDVFGLVDATDSSITSNTLSAPAGGTLGVMDVTQIHLLRTAVDDNHLVGGSGKFDCGLICTSELHMDSSSLSGNTRTYGANAGGRSGLCSELICFGSGQLDITNSTVADNVLTAGINTELQGQYVDGDTTVIRGAVVAILNSTVARNRVHLGAGSSYTRGPFSGKSVSIQNSIFGENTPKNCGSTIIATATVTHTLDTDGSCGFASGNGNIKNQNAQFVGNTQVNAPGKTRTLAIGAGSPAKDTADNNLCPTLDQRGVTRLADDPLCDMGAYEFVRAATVTPSPTPVLPRAGGRAPGNFPGLWLMLLGAVVAAGGFPAALRASRRAA